MALSYGAIAHESVARQIADNIRAAIPDGRLKIDERLPTDEDLARKFVISRPTVREALNLIRSRRGPAGGTFAIRPDADSVADAFTASATLLVGVGAF